jgi:hypothetical protein
VGGWDDREYYEEEAAQAEFIQETLKNISEDGVRNYLGTYGDAVDARIEHCMKEARMLLTGGFFQSAVVSAVTAIELTIRFLLLRPLMQAAFLSEEWASLLTQRIASGRGSGDREILPQILNFHDIDLNNIKLPGGKALWATITDVVYSTRNKIVHRAEPHYKTMQFWQFNVPTSCEAKLLCLTRKSWASLSKLQNVGSGRRS